MGFAEQERQRALLAHFERAGSLHKGGKVDEAISEFQAALKVDPRHAPSRYNLALVLESKGRNAEAAAEFEAFLACASKEELQVEAAVRARIASLRRKSGGTQSLDPGGKTLTLGGGETVTLGGGKAPADAAPAQTDLAWRPGQVVDGLYEVREVLGEGGYGTVHKVWHRGWGLGLAVKAPLAHKVARRQVLEAFVQEANAWVGLGLHPHIVTCYYVRVMGVPRIFIEYMAGGSLVDWLEFGKAREPVTALDCAIQITRAMEYVHRRGLVHRDLKPGNCLMKEDGTLKVTDFGLVHVGAEDADEGAPQTPGAKIAKVKSATATGKLGTPEYMAPEQWTSPRTEGKAADVWAFGAMLHELFCGKKAFKLAEDEPADSFYARLLTSNWAYEGRKAAAPDLDALIGRCLSVDPAKRPADFAEVKQALEAAHARLFGSAYPRPAVKEPPILADALVNQGVSMADLGRADEALRLFGEALRLDPVHAGATYNAGFVLAKRGRADGNLVPRLSAMRRSQARDWVPAYLLGQAYQLQGEEKAGAKALAEADSLSPGNAFILRAATGTAELYVALPKGTERAHEETTAFHRHMDRAQEFQAKGDFEKAYTEVKAARAVSGYERADEALALARELGRHGTRSGLRGGWQKVFFRGSEGAKEIALVGATLVSRHEDGTVKVWDPGTGKLLRAETGAIMAATAREARTADRRYRIAGMGNGSLEVAEAKSGKVVMETKGHAGPITAVLLAADDSAAYTAGPDGVRRWELDWDYEYDAAAPSPRTGRHTHSAQSHAHAVPLADAGAIARHHAADAILNLCPYAILLLLASGEASGGAALIGLAVPIGVNDLRTIRLLVQALRSRPVSPLLRQELWIDAYACFSQSLALVLVLFAVVSEEIFRQRISGRAAELLELSVKACMGLHGTAIIYYGARFLFGGALERGASLLLRLFSGKSGPGGLLAAAALMLIFLFAIMMLLVQWSVG